MQKKIMVRIIRDIIHPMIPVNLNQARNIHLRIEAERMPGIRTPAEMNKKTLCLKIK